MAKPDRSAAADPACPACKRAWSQHPGLAASCHQLQEALRRLAFIGAHAYAIPAVDIETIALTPLDCPVPALPPS